MTKKRRGLLAGMWILGRSSGNNVPNPAPTCAKCGIADWAHHGQHLATDGHAFVRKETK